MILLNDWATAWNISMPALQDLRQRMGAANTDAPPVGTIDEAGVQSLVRLEASVKGARLWRNNVGAYQTPDGAFVRYGLANDTKAMNRLIKSSDLIGLRPITITTDHVGAVLGQFIAREIKHSAWRYTGAGREPAQLKFLELVNALGGDGSFAVSEGTL